MAAIFIQVITGGANNVSQLKGKQESKRAKLKRVVQHFIRLISAVFWTNSLFFQQVKQFSGMRSALKNVGCPFLCCNEMRQLMFSLQGQYFTTSRGIFFPLFLPPPHVPVPKKHCYWCTKPLLFQDCRRRRTG